MKNKKNLPLYNILKDYKNKYRLHMPGHKGGNLIKKYKFSGSFDITELPFSDNLLNSQSVIKEAENLYAKCYNAKAVKFSTCGSSINILSILHSVKHLGKSIIIEKNSHKSVYSACKISNIEPVIINNKLQQNNLFIPITAKDIQQELSNNSNCIGAIITSPNYYGFFADIKQIADILHKQKKILIVDASHGAHLPFLYKDIYKYCDMYICSAHKTLPALTSASIACFNNLNLYKDFLNSFNIFHTSSPSYLILASIDTARYYMQNYGKEKLLELKKLSQSYKKDIENFGFTVIENDDFTKLIIEKKGSCGKALYDYLAKNNIYCELYDNNYILAMFTVADNKKTFKKLFTVLKKFNSCNNAIKNNKIIFAEKVMPYLKAFNSEKELIPLNKAVGRILACDIGLYPPSYPLVCCGDKISSDICIFFTENKEQAFGLDKDCIYVVK